jgi:hypothetical protein
MTTMLTGNEAYTGVPTAEAPLIDVTTRPQRRAERLLAEYLRLWGLRDPSTVAIQCRSWVRQASSGDAHGVGPEFLYGRSIQLANGDLDQWLNRLATLVAEDTAAAQSRRGLLAIELQSLIDRYPTALLAHEALPPTLLHRLQRAARPVVPAAKATPMRPQPLGELPSLLRLQWWGQLVSRLLSGFRLLRPARDEVTSL